ncbi:MAG: lactate utilization protein C [Salinigranum sp.]
MPTETVAAFEASLDRLDVDRTRTTPDGFEAVLAEAARKPTIGVPLPFPEVSLPQWVETNPTPADLESAATGVTAASLGIADYGSVVIRATPEPTEQVSLFPTLHVAVVRESDVVPGMAEAFARFGPEMRDRRASAIIATGPSATADMGELVRGVHGPREVHVVILTDESEGDGQSTADRPEGGQSTADRPEGGQSTADRPGDDQ